MVKNNKTPLESHDTPNKESFRSKLGKVLFNPGVMVALVGSVGVGIITNTVTNRIARRELQYNVIASLMEYTQKANLDSLNDIMKLQAISGIIEDNEELKVDAHGFKYLVKWSLNKQVEMQKESEKNFIDSIPDEIKEDIDKIDILEKRLVASNDKRQQEKLEKKIDSIIEKNVDIVDQQNDINKKGDHIYEIKEEVIKPYSKDKGFIDDLADEDINKKITNENWLKEGYYRIHNGYRICIESLDEVNSKIQLSITDDIRKQKFFNEPVNLWEKVQIPYRSYILEFTLESIGKAGKNPFKKAAFYTFKIYEVQSPVQMAH